VEERTVYDVDDLFRDGGDVGLMQRPRLTPEKYFLVLISVRD
jgi:hypothetical protein